MTQKLDPASYTVLALSGVRGDTRRYRSFHPYEQLSLASAPGELAHITDPELPVKISRAAVVIFHRTSHDGYVDRLIKGLRDRGGVAIADVDDLIFDPAAFQWIDSPDFQDPLRATLYQEDMRRHQATLNACQAVLASTEYLAGRAREIGRPAWVHRNGFSLEMLTLSEQAYRAPKTKSGRLVIGYASGTPTHDHDFAILRPALEAVLQQYPHVEICLIGPLNPGGGWGALGERIKPHKLVPWRQLPAMLARFDINLAPLVMDNPFGQSKSEIKYMEAALVRVPTIASPTAAFIHGIRNGETGLLAQTPEAWQGALQALIEDENQRKRMGEAAYQDVLQRYHPRVRAAELVRTLDKIYEHVHRQPLKGLPKPDNLTGMQEPGHASDVIRVTRTAERDLTLTRMALYTLRHRGGQILLKQARVYLRRLLSPIFPYK